MQYAIFLEKLKRKYSYSEKLSRALDKIFPVLVSYYGREHFEYIKEAFNNTKIIECNSYQTIPILLEQLLPDEKISSDASLGGIYVSSPKIMYHPIVSSYIVPKISRYIILSHTYNLDAISGLSILTEQLCRLVRSYSKEYNLSLDTLTCRSGISKKTYKLQNKNDKITNTLVKDEHHGLEEGFVSYDTEKIVSMIVNDKYHHFSCEFEKKMAYILYETLDFKKNILDSVFTKDFYSFISTFDVQEGLFFQLSSLIDQAYELEQKSLNVGTTKEEKIIIKEQMSEISSKVVENLTIYLEERKKEPSKNLGS